MKKPLWKISVSILEQAEEPVSALLESLFGQTPSIYTDEDSRKTTASVFLARNSVWSPSVKSRLVGQLKELRNSGIDIGSARISAKKLQPEDWAESWKKHFEPIQVGKSLLIKPSWERIKPGKNQSCVILDPGLSFGTGQHATTLFCLQQLAVCRKTNQKQSFLDMGTGSGILAIAAAKLGYSPIRAFDFDPESIRVSCQNAAKNGVADQMRLSRQDLRKLPLQSKQKFDVICANLMHDLLLSERQRIINRLASNGSLILAGILKQQFKQVQTAYEDAGLTLIKTKVLKEWQSGHFKR